MSEVSLRNNNIDTMCSQKKHRSMLTFKPMISSSSSSSSNVDIEPSMNLYNKDTLQLITQSIRSLHREYPYKCHRLSIPEDHVLEGTYELPIDYETLLELVCRLMKWSCKRIKYVDVINLIIEKANNAVNAADADSVANTADADSVANTVVANTAADAAVANTAAADASNHDVIASHAELFSSIDCETLKHWEEHYVSIEQKLLQNSEAIRCMYIPSTRQSWLLDIYNASEKSISLDRSFLPNLKSVLGIRGCSLELLKNVCHTIEHLETDVLDTHISKFVNLKDLVLTCKTINLDMLRLVPSNTLTSLDLSKVLYCYSSSSSRLSSCVNNKKSIETDNASDDDNGLKALFGESSSLILNFVNLEHLVLPDQYNGPVDNLFSLSKLKRIIFGNKFNHYVYVHSNGKLDNLEHVRFGDDYSASLTNYLYLPSLRSISLTCICEKTFTNYACDMSIRDWGFKLEELCISEEVRLNNITSFISYICRAFRNLKKLSIFIKKQNLDQQFVIQNMIKLYRLQQLVMIPNVDVVPIIQSMLHLKSITIYTSNIFPSGGIVSSNNGSGGSVKVDEYERFIECLKSHPSIERVQVVGISRDSDKELSQFKRIAQFEKTVLHSYCNDKQSSSSSTDKGRVIVIS